MKRIGILASLTKGYDTICDIGCDHAYVILEALNKYDVKYAYAIDVNLEPLERAKTNIKKANLLSKVSFYLSDGLKDFDKSFNLAIISGMGGKLITNILNSSWNKFSGKDLLLSPQSDIVNVRLFLYSKGYRIKYETAIYENNKYYEIILATPGFKNLNYFELVYGPCLLNNKIFLEQLSKILKIKETAYLKSNLKELKEDIIKMKYITENKMEKIYYYKENYYTKMFVNDELNDLIIIFPGGGYDHTSPREAENIALKFNGLGYNVVVFHYRETLDDYKTLFPSISEAIIKIKEENKINNIYFNAYSAGSHLALELANHGDLYKLPKIRGLILCYPVVSTRPTAIHEGSFNCLLNGDKTLYERYSEELEVNKDTPEVFLWHTVTDKSVPIYNSIYLMEALTKNNINFESHIFPMGGHGLGLATKDSARDESDIIPYVADWFNMATKWLNLKK